MAGEKPVKIVVTGGHHTPALAVMAALKKRGNFEFHFIGRATSLRSEKTTSVEKRTMEKLGIPFYNLKTGKLYKSGVGELVKIPGGFLQAFWLLMRIRPRLIVSFGGYLAAPVMLAGFFLRIPRVTHEQTVVSGWANRFSAYLANKIFVSWEPSRKFFPKDKTVLTGNPLREEIFNPKGKKIIVSRDLPTVYITGGKQGSHLINEVVRVSLSQFLENYNLIHQTGSSASQDYQKLILLKNQLPKALKKRYLVQEYFGEEEIGAVLAATDAVVGRSGANTVTEIAAKGLPSVLIPIPWVSHNEQEENAKILSERGAALIISQDKLSAPDLLLALAQIFSHYKEFKKHAEEARSLIKPNAAERIASEILAMLDLS
ncbi:MAG: UDP-N-acetylglucosamine--N-acetylmuramyl-(pentapeptide) pyrophosphoryl-undecaprenol N-acetylglucosamine transferase [Patescibacteria group bacterium]